MMPAAKTPLHQSPRRVTAQLLASTEEAAGEAKAPMSRTAAKRPLSRREGLWGLGGHDGG